MKFEASVGFLRRLEEGQVGIQECRVDSEEIPTREQLSPPRTLPASWQVPMAARVVQNTTAAVYEHGGGNCGKFVDEMESDQGCISDDVFEAGPDSPRELRGYSLMTTSPRPNRGTARATCVTRATAEPFCRVVSRTRSTPPPRDAGALSRPVTITSAPVSASIQS